MDIFQENLQKFCFDLIIQTKIETEEDNIVDAALEYMFNCNKEKIQKHLENGSKIEDVKTLWTKVITDCSDGYAIKPEIVSAYFDQKVRPMIDVIQAAKVTRKGTRKAKINLDI